MVYALWAAVCVIGLLSLLTLVLTVGVIRRLREHTERLDGLYERTGTPAPGLQAGEVADDFEATTGDGETLSGASLGERTLIGFFSPSCKPCKELAPKFVELAAGMSRDEVIAVIAGFPDEMGDMRDLLSPVAKVVADDADGGPLAKAFGVEAFPRVFLVDEDRKVLAAGHTLDALDGVLAPAHG
ncbi:TlpA family protein disulfide reductase [Nonomuraea sediminis]|uniref:TlpA family protein disulfide reductase n=1 Tax=Nonomuraea sediminis TaxID=2835864 RepID=UPI001BDC8EC0|nr:TlpA disulfide reductase family protein [Nonomuraea sediminis]